MRFRNDLVITAFCDLSFIGSSNKMRNHLNNLRINPNTKKLWSYNQIIGMWEIDNDNIENNKLWIYTKTKVMGQYFSQTTSKVVGQLVREAIEQDVDFGFYNDETQECYNKNFNFKKKEKVKTTKVSKKWFKENDENCSICLCNHEYNIIKTKCGHHFHKKCFKQFLSSTDNNTQKNCPLCKQDLINGNGNVIEEASENLQEENAPVIDNINLQAFLNDYMADNNINQLIVEMGEGQEIQILSAEANSVSLNIEDLPDIELSDIEEITL